MAALVAGHGFDYTVAPTVTAGAYSAGDIVGGLLTFTVSESTNVGVIITGITVAVKAAVTSLLTLVLFSANPTGTTTTDNAAYSLAAADVLKVISTISLGSVATLVDHGTPNTYSVDGLSIVCKPVADTSNIYGLLIDGTGWTLTATTDIQVRIRGLGV